VQLEPVLELEVEHARGEVSLGLEAGEIGGLGADILVVLSFGGDFGLRCGFY
jgi:hypothetical protein